VFHYLVGNADAHAKNVSLLHVAGGVRLAPLYDVVCTAAYPELSTELALAVGDELEPESIGSIHWSDLAEDFGLSAPAFARARRRLVDDVQMQAGLLAREASEKGWHHPCVDSIVDVVGARAPRVL
jgi:serine/threonine-protein kinase HipA